MFRRFLQITIFCAVIFVLTASNIFSQERVLSPKEALEQAMTGNSELLYYEFFKEKVCPLRAGEFEV